MRASLIFQICVLASISLLSTQCRVVDVECQPADISCDLQALWLYTGPGVLPTTGRVRAFQKISNDTGNLTAALDNTDYFGWSTGSPGDLNRDGVRDVVVGASLDDDGGSGRGAAYVLFLNRDGTVNTHQKISDTLGGLSTTLDDLDLFGNAVASIGDLNADGNSELAVGVNFDDDGGAERGAVYILFLNSSGTVTAEQKISDTQGGLAAALADNDEFGIAVAGLGDVDGDGVPDLAASAYLDDDGGNGRGALYVLFLNANGTVKSEQKISDTQGGLTTTLDDDDNFGRALAALGDLDGDGVTEIAVGAWRDDDAGNNRGSVYILFLNANGTVKAEQKISATQGGPGVILDDDDEFGTSLSAAGDLDGDLVPDLVVGSYQDDDGGTNRGAVYVLFLNRDGTVKSRQKISDTEGSFAALLDNDDRFGQSVALPGDIDGDLVPDLIVGANFDDDGGVDRGAAYVLFLEEAE